MSPEVAEALEASIRHWDENAKAERPEDAHTTGAECALCQLFKDRGGIVRCDKCPVAKRVDADSCEGTPYHKAWAAPHGWRLYQNTEAKKRFHVAALAERDFLISLREPVES